MPSRALLFVTSWAAAHQVALSMEFSRQEYWNRLSFPSPGNLSDPGFEPRSLALQADSLLSEPPGKSMCGRHSTIPNELNDKIKSGRKPCLISALLHSPSFTSAAQER